MLIRKGEAFEAIKALEDEITRRLGRQGHHQLR
jgi:hypothetical protein